MTKKLIKMNAIFVLLMCIWIGFLESIHCCILRECMPFTQRCFRDAIKDPCRANVGCNDACPDGSSHKGQPLIPGKILTN